MRRACLRARRSRVYNSRPARYVRRVGEYVQPAATSSGARRKKGEEGRKKEDRDEDEEEEEEAERRRNDRARRQGVEGGGRASSARTRRSGRRARREKIREKVTDLIGGNEFKMAAAARSPRLKWRRDVLIAGDYAQCVTFLFAIDRRA